MPILIPGKVRSIQPQQVVGIDYDSFLGSGVTHCLPLNGNPFEICRNGRLTYGSAASRGDSYRGTTLKSAGGAACASIPLDISAYDKATVSFWLYWNSYTNTDLLALEYGANYRTNNGFIVDPSSGSPYSGYFQIGVGANPSSSNNAGYARPSAAVWHHYMCCFDRSSGATYKQALYVDGVLLTPVSNTTTSIGNNFANNTLYLFSRAGTSLYGAGQMQNLVIRAGMLGTADLAAEEYRNPWGIFAPRKTALYFAMEAGGATASINITAANASASLSASVSALAALNVTAANPAVSIGASVSPLAAISITAANASASLSAEGAVGVGAIINIVAESASAALSASVSPLAAINASAGDAVPSIALSGLIDLVTTRGGGLPRPRGIYWQNQPSRKIKRSKLDQILDTMGVEEEEIKEFVEEHVEQPEVKKAIRKHVSPVTQQIKWPSLENDIAAIKKLMAEYEQYLLEQDDEDILEILMEIL